MARARSSQLPALCCTDAAVPPSLLGEPAAECTGADSRAACTSVAALLGISAWGRVCAETTHKVEQRHVS